MLFLELMGRRMTLKDAVFFRLYFHLPRSKKFRSSSNHRILWAERDLQRFSVQVPSQSSSKWNSLLSIMSDWFHSPSRQPVIWWYTWFKKPQNNPTKQKNPTTYFLFMLFPVFQHESILPPHTSEKSQPPSSLQPPLATQGQNSALFLRLKLNSLCLSS